MSKWSSNARRIAKRTRAALKRLDKADEAFISLRSRVTDLETKADLAVTKFAEHDQRITVLENKADTAQGILQDHEARIAALE